MDPLTNEFISKAGVNVFTEIFKSCYNGLKSTGKWIIDQDKEHDFFGTAAKTYVGKLQKRFGSIRIMGMSNPVSLRKIYTNVNILEKITSQQRETLEDLEIAFDKDRRRFGPIRQTKPGLAVVDELNNFILLGKPGSGKTTFLKYITLFAAEGYLKKPRIPIFVELKQLADSGVSLMDYLVEQFDICNFSEANSFINRLLIEGKAIVLFDGLDEVPKDKEISLIREIENFTNKYDENQYIISCRIAAYTYCFERFSDVEIADFNESQINNFVFNWYGDDTRTAKACLTQMNSSPPIKELAKTPLLLTLLCLAFDEDLRFPSNRADLYNDAIEALLKKWDISRRIIRDEVYKSLSVARKEAMLSQIAADTFEKNQYFFHERTLKEQISTFISNLPEVKESSLEADSQAVLKSIEAQHGIFVERARGIYSFSHLTLQEFFTAKYIVNNSRSGTLEKITELFLTDIKWREVFLIISGLLTNADDFLKLIDNAVKSNTPTQVSSVIETNDDLLKTLCAETKPELHPSFVRAILLENVLFSNSEIAWVKDQSKLSEKVFCLLEGHTNFHRYNEEYPIDRDPDYLVFGNILETNSTMMLAINNCRISHSSSNNFMRYWQGVTLLLDCLFTGCYLNKETKKTILNNLFTNP